MDDTGRRGLAAAFTAIALLKVGAAVGDGLLVERGGWWNEGRLRGFAIGRMEWVGLLVLLIALCLHRLRPTGDRRERSIALAALLAGVVAIAGTAANIVMTFTEVSNATFRIGVSGPLLATALTIIAGMVALWPELGARPAQPRVWEDDE